MLAKSPNQSASTTSLLVVIPAFNEQASIGRVVADTKRCTDRLSLLGYQPEICVVDDGSADKTADVARSAGADHVIVHRLNRGCGAAVRSGLLHGRSRGSDLAVKLDGDGQHDPADIPELIRPIVEDRADVVYGNRFPRMSYAMPVIRRAGNVVFRALMRWLTHWDIKDSQPGIFALNSVYLKICFIPGDYNYTQQVLLDAYLKDMRFEQVPVAFKRRQSGRSFISLAYPFMTLPQILRLMVLVKPLKVFLPLAALFLTAATLLFVIEVAQWLSGNASRPVEHVNLVMGLALFGLNTGFFGLLADLVVQKSS